MATGAPRAPLGVASPSRLGIALPVGEEAREEEAREEEAREGLDPARPAPSGADPRDDPHLLRARVLAAVAVVFTATITGRVVDVAGRPVSKTRVAVQSVLWGREGAAEVTTQTGLDGRFQLRIEDSGSVQLSLEPPAETDLIPQDVMVRVRRGGEIDLGDTPLASGGRVEGRVDSSRGGPLVGVTIRLQRGGLSIDRLLTATGLGFSFDDVTDWGDRIEINEYGINQYGARQITSIDLRGQPGPTATSRADGSYTLHSVPPGSYTLVADGGKSAIARRDGISVQAGQVRAGVDFRLVQGPVLEVEVRDPLGTPIQGAVVAATDEEGVSMAFVTNAEGVGVTPEPFAGRQFQLTVTALGMQAQVCSVEAPEGAERFRIRLTVLAGAQVTGRCDTAGQVYLHRREGGPYRPAHREAEPVAQVGDSHRGIPEDPGTSRFTSASLPPGRYDVLLVDQWARWNLLAKEVWVQSGQCSDLGRLTPVLLDELRLTVFDAKGTPVVGALVASQHAELPIVASDAAGRCQLALPPGDYTYTVTAPSGVQVSTVLGGGGLRSVQLPAAKCWLRVVSVGAGTTTHSFKVRQGARLIKAGSFRLEALVELAEPGRYQLEVGGVDHGQVDVGEGGTTSVEVRPLRAVSCQVRVLSPAGQPLAGVEVSITDLDPRPSEARASVWRVAQSLTGRTNRLGVLNSTLTLGPGIAELFVALAVDGQESVYRLPLSPAGELQATLRLRHETRARVEIDASELESPGARIELKPLTALTARNQIATLDERGRATFAGVRPGRYRVSPLGTTSPPVDVDVSTGGSVVLSLRAR